MSGNMYANLSDRELAQACEGQASDQENDDLRQLLQECADRLWEDHKKRVR